MSNLIEVETENSSYTPFLNLDSDSEKSIRLTTLTDNQTGAIIKIALNKNGIRVPLKEFRVAGITPGESGIPRFELTGVYNGKTLHLRLKIDGREGENSEIKLSPYLRNKKIPFYAAALIITLLLFIWGGGLFIKSLTYTENKQLPPAESEKTLPVTNIRGTDKTVPAGDPVEQEEKPSASGPVTVKTELIEKIIYFTPDSTTITEEAFPVLDGLIPVLQKNKTAVVEISGHCALSGTEEGREQLSRERAFTTLRYLKQKGWTPEKEPVVRWYGGTRLLSTSPEEIYRNRRVEIRISFQTGDL